MIQYAGAVVVDCWRRSLLDRPVKPGDDSLRQLLRAHRFKDAWSDGRVCAMRRHTLPNGRGNSSVESQLATQAFTPSSGTA